MVSLGNQVVQRAGFLGNPVSRQREGSWGNLGDPQREGFGDTLVVLLTEVSLGNQGVLQTAESLDTLGAPVR